MPLTESDLIRIRQFLQKMESGLVEGMQVYSTYHDSNLAALPSDPTGAGTTGGWHREPTEASNWLSTKTAFKDTSGTWGTPIRVFGLQGTETAGVGLSADIPKLEQITFIGDGSSKVGWTPGTVTYGGTSYAIDVKAVGDGSTDAYIYWDDADGQTSFKTTATFATAIAANHWVVCFNDSGKAIPATSARILHGGLIQANTITASQILVSGLDSDGELEFDEKGPGQIIQEYFENPNSDVATRWPSVSGGGEESIEAGGLTGGHFYRIGDNSGVDQRWMVHYKNIPYDESKLYRIRCRLRRTQGSGTVYIGVNGRNGADDAWVDTSGVDGHGSTHWIAAAGVNPDATWTVYTGYFKGRDSTGSGTAHADPADPGVLHDDVRYFRPVILVNFNAEAGIVEIDEYSIDIIPEDADQVAESSTKRWASETGADITGDHEADISLANIGEKLVDSLVDGTYSRMLTAWRKAGDATKIDGGHISTTTILAAAIATYELTAINATIENLMVKTAHIDNLNVTTGKIAADATTIVESATTVAELIITSFSTYIEVQTVQIVCAGGIVEVMVSVDHEMGTGDLAMDIKIVRTSTTIGIWEDVPVLHSQIQNWNAGPILDSPGSGTITYYIYARKNAGGGGNLELTNRTLYLKEYKK